MIRRPPRSTRTDNSFPTRRSSDLSRCGRPDASGVVSDRDCGRALSLPRRPEPVGGDDRVRAQGAGRGMPRSEEHTSELQSLMRISYAVFCLKKKKNSNTLHRTEIQHTQPNLDKRRRHTNTT